jgi:hypothetical protein
MNKIASIIAVAALGIIAAPASAAASQRCTAPSRLHLAVRQSGTSCTAAQALGRYIMTHESLDGSFHAVGRQWLGNIVGRPLGHTRACYVSKGRLIAKVWITAPFAAG